MKNDHDDYYYNPYISGQRAGKGESMSSVRASFIFAFAILVSVGAVLLYLDHTGRFEMAPSNQGLYIFDKKTTATNFCDTYRCIGISPEFILPKKVEIVQIPGVNVTSQIQQPTPTIASLMMPQPEGQVPMPIPPAVPANGQAVAVPGVQAPVDSNGQAPTALAPQAPVDSNDQPPVAPVAQAPTPTPAPLTPQAPAVPASPQPPSMAQPLPTPLPSPQMSLSAQQAQPNNGFRVMEDEDMGGFIDAPQDFMDE